MASRTCVLYARISISTDESVSIARQLEAGHSYAKARGWRVIGEFVDEGISATRNRPEDRAGWQALMACRDLYDAVVIWKVDRLARRVLDFLHADEALQDRKAAVVAVEDPIDMSTGQGRAFATMLAVFAELEADNIRTRVKDARRKLIKDGRYAGGGIPYGWKALPNPTGKGYVVVQDSDRIEHVRAMAERTLAGRGIYSTVQWLNDNGIPTAKWHVPLAWSEWKYNTVEGILRHPILAGMTIHNPDSKAAHNKRGDDVLRGEDGLPVINPNLAVMPVGEWRAMVARLDAPGADNRKLPRAMRTKTSGVLSGLLFCGEHNVDEPTRMWRGTTQGRPSYSCPVCHQTLSTAEPLIIETFLQTMGEAVRWTPVVDVVEGGAAVLPEITNRLNELGQELLNAKGDRVPELLSELARIKTMQADAEALPSVVKQVWQEAGTFGEAWAAATDDEDRRDVLGDAIDHVWVIRGRQGGWTREGKLARLVFDWTWPEPGAEPSQEELAAWAPN